jgi:hypothetical protein
VPGCGTNAGLESCVGLLGDFRYFLENFLKVFGVGEGVSSTGRGAWIPGTVALLWVQAAKGWAQAGATPSLYR